MPRARNRDVLAHLDAKYFSSPEAKAQLQSARESAAVARQIYALRKQAGLTQRELAERIGTTNTVISRLENDDYEGHSLAMLRRIASALGRRVELRFVPIGPEPEVGGP